jgi:hypothetical protein
VDSFISRIDDEEYGIVLAVKAEKKAVKTFAIQSKIKIILI